MDLIYPYNSDADGNEIRNLYKFSDQNALITRLRRVEKTVPYLRRGNSVVTTSASQSVDSAALTTNNAVDLTSSAITKMGSVPPAGITGQFAAITTTNSITWYWDGTNGSTPLVIHRTDGTTLAVPHGHLAVTGLNPSTTYYFLPYWSVYNYCAPGWVVGTIGSPQIAFVLADTTSATSGQYYVMQQSLQNREPLSAAWMTQATTAAGTGGGGAGGGGGGGSCVMSGTDIEPIGDYGDMQVGIHHQFHWNRLLTSGKKVLQATPNHPVYVLREEDKAEVQAIIDEHGYKEELLEPWKMELQSAEPGEHLVITRDGFEEVVRNDPFNRNCTKRSVHLDRGHLYWAAGVLSHNLKPIT